LPALPGLRLTYYVHNKLNVFIIELRPITKGLLNKIPHFISKKTRKAKIIQHQVELNISQNDAEMSDILTFSWILDGGL